MAPNGAAPPDPLDEENYDPIIHLNAIFSHPSTLSSADRTSKVLRSYQDELDDSIADLVDSQSASHAESVERIQAAKADLTELFKKIEDVRARALRTEQAITNMTADIKQLDNTKRNLTLSMTALKRLQMLTTAYEQLRALAKARQYRECAQLLQAVIQLMANFKSYRSIDQIATLSRNVSDLQHELLEQICEDFELSFTTGEVESRVGMLAEGCLVMDALGEHARSRIVTWYCNTQLREYRQVFRGNDEAGSLDNITRRYSWFRRMMKTYEEEHAAIFPPHWRVNEIIANVFCEGTREDFKGILQRSSRSGQNIDVNLLLSCLQETLEFEHSLERRFASTSRASIDTMTSVETPPTFTQTISEAFEPYLSLWVEAQDKQLAGMIPKYRQQPPISPDEDFTPEMVIASSTELFNFYRLSLNQCAKLSTGQSLAELSKVFGKYLDSYAQSVLLYYISERPTGRTPSHVPTIEDQILVLNTADYCYTTSTQLEEKIRSRIDEPFKAGIDLQSQADAFMGIASAVVRQLVRRVEIELDPCWREMRNTPWNKLESIGDQSSYVAELLTKVKTKSDEILETLHKQQYARAFADNLVELLASSFIANIGLCRPVSEVGAEQMLLDAYTLKTGFQNLLPSPQPASFTKRVTQSMSKIDPLLKTLQVRPSPPEALVQAYLIHIGDRSDANFKKILEIKGIRSKAEQGHLTELFQMHRTSDRYNRPSAGAGPGLIDRNPIITSLVLSGPGTNGPGSSTAAGSSSTSTTGGLLPVSSSSLGLGSLALPGSGGVSGVPVRFDPRDIGSALISAARDGVDRLGNTVPGGGGGSSGAGTDSGATPSGMVSPPLGTGEARAAQAAANLNENLKNIGKFFRRDIGGFGGKFGGSN